MKEKNKEFFCKKLKRWSSLMSWMVGMSSSKCFLKGASEVSGCFRVSNLDTFNMSDGDVLDSVHEAHLKQQDSIKAIFFLYLLILFTLLFCNH